MHRHLFQVYPETEDNSSVIHIATRLFRSLLQGSNEDASKVSSADSVLTDVVAEYLIDIKLYTRSDYQPEKARDILRGLRSSQGDILINTSSLSSPMERYLLETIRPELIQSKIDAKSLFQQSIDEYKQKYNEDRDYPIYVRSLGAKEKYEKTLSHLSQAEEVVEWLIKTKSSSSSID
jgi:hypothetical protein